MKLANTSLRDMVSSTVHNNVQQDLDANRFEVCFGTVWPDPLEPANIAEP